MEGLESLDQFIHKGFFLKENSYDLIFMEEALKLAKTAEKQGEVPVGAVLVHKNQIIASTFNQKESLKKATAPCRNFSYRKSLFPIRALAFKRLHLVCHSGALPDVCRSSRHRPFETPGVCL